MSEYKYRLYCFLHHTAKRFLGRASLSTGNIFHLSNYKTGVKKSNAFEMWSKFISKSFISNGDFCGIHYAGYIGESNEWCLPSWIWTNAAIVREYCLIGKLAEAEILAAKLAEHQQECGGWIVRNDYDKKGPIPMLAPNDSAYIANNAFLTLYERTNDEKYLNIARRCANWIMNTVRPDGMVYVGYNMRDQKWDKDCVIVDVGFTGGLFAQLYKFTHDAKYLSFLERFTERYIELFYIPSKFGFCTSIDANGNKIGGMFGRGQAWALEGLIPAYQVLKSRDIRQIIEDTIENLMRQQHPNGAWAYNLTKPLMGEDCKAVSVIAKNMMDWYKISKDERIRKSAIRAFDWCCKHTAIDKDAAGGIFSFCMEGAIVQNLYTSCAFVYASAYAIELNEMLNQK